MGETSTRATVSTVLEDPLVAISREHAQERALCDTLEAIADALPSPPDPALCASLTRELDENLLRHHADEEVGLFPLLRARAHPEDRAEEILAHLEEEHAEAEALAAEVVATLEQLANAACGPPCASEAAVAGYVLRGFFQSRRRHLVWEEATVLPMAATRLGLCDRRELAALMSRIRNAPPKSALARRNARGERHASN